MMKSGAPPDKFGVLYHMVTYRILWFQKRNYTCNSKGYHSLVPGLISIFLEMVWVPLNMINEVCMKNKERKFLSFKPLGDLLGDWSWQHKGHSAC